jgi:hypothetical protein
MFLSYLWARFTPIAERALSANLGLHDPSIAIITLANSSGALIPLAQ